MSRAARSVYVFGFYMAVLGVALVATPNLLLALNGLPATSEVWIRVVGVLVLCLAVYYLLAARHELTEFFRWTVFVRASVMVFFAAFVVLGFVRPVFVVFGVVDLAAATWTALALRSDRLAAG
jgi:hypothetical protein